MAIKKDAVKLILPMDIIVQTDATAKGHFKGWVDAWGFDGTMRLPPKMYQRFRA